MSDNKMSLKDKVTIFANAQFEAALATVRCGFELETQKINGLNNEGLAAIRSKTPSIQYDAKGFALDKDGLETQVKLKIDNTVRAPEVVTVGPKTAAEFLSALRKLTAHDLEVDTHCSFHVHLSIPEVKHRYGKRFQLSMYEYIFKNLDQVPECVKARWKNSAQRGQYFEYHLQSGKYAFVRYHESYNTWEFRCFGNVKTFEDGQRCLELAVKAMQYAYRCVLKSEKMMLNPDKFDKKVLDDALARDLPIAEVLPVESEIRSA